MAPANSIALLINALTIPLALFMFILLLWQDSRRSSNLVFGLVLGTLVLWASGSLLARASANVGAPRSITEVAMRLLDFGFNGTCISLYLFVIVLSGVRGKTFVWIATAAALALLLYQGWVALATVSPAFEVRPDGTLRYNFNEVGGLLYLSLVFAAMIVGWQSRRRIKAQNLLLGIFVFSCGILIELISPDLRSKSVGLDLSAFAALLMSSALVKQQIIDPLRGRAAQLRAVRDVGLAITSQIRLEEALSTIAKQAAEILQADGAAIFLQRGALLELAAVHNMPPAFKGYRLSLGEGVAGQVARTRNATRLNEYHREWTGLPDMPFARESFGSMIAGPLIVADEVMGVLVVVEGVQGRRFEQEDLDLLELLGPQAAVAIKNSRLFEGQHALTAELEAVNNKLETVLTSTRSPVIALNRRFEIIFANPAAVNLIDYSTITGRSIFDVIPRHAIPAHPRKVLRELRQTRSYTYEMTMNSHTYLCQLGLLGETKPEGYVAVLNDVSQLKEIDRLKNQMIHMTSHDLKNPLAAAMFHVELLQEEGEDRLTEEMRADVETIWVQLQRMQRIISNILDVEKVQSGTLTYEDCDISRLVQTGAQELSAQAARGGVTLTVDLPTDLPLVHGSRHHLTQALTNLIENAVKFTLSGGEVRISGEAQEEVLILHISDTGIGIAPEDQPRLFEKFFRGSRSAAEGVNGSGLGLSLVKAIIDAHQGRIWLESKVDKGTTVHLLLPLRRGAAERFDDSVKDADPVL